jgi:hypothetical protein
VKIKVVLFMSIIVGLVACEKVNYPVNDTINIGFGKVYRYDADMSIKFDSVVEDSRCPVGWECLCSGVAIVALDVSVNNHISSFRLTDFGGFKQDTLITGYRIGIVDLSPYPGRAEILRDSIFVTLRVQK